MNGRGSKLFLFGLAIAGSMGASACGGTADAGLGDAGSVAEKDASESVDGADARGGSMSDVGSSDTAADATTVGVADGGTDSTSDVEVVVADATVDSMAADVGVADAARDAPTHPDAGDAGGNEAGDAGGNEAGDAGGNEAGDGGCSLGSTQCSGSSVETCGSNGQWGAPFPCTTGTCTGTACTGSTATGTSCQTTAAGSNDCGSGNQSCCMSQEFTGGPFFRTYMNTGSGPTGEADPATVSGSRVDTYLVTVGRFRKFVAAWNGGSGYTPPEGSGKHTHLNGGMGLANSGTAGTYELGWDTSDDSNVAPTDVNLACDPENTNATWTPSVGKNEDMPINCVNWYEAYAFCIWDGGFLPSETEWEYAAAGGGGTDGLREFPWGTTDPGNNNQFAIYGDFYKGGQLAPVGTATKGAGRFGQLDLAGEVFEWGLDVVTTYVSPCVDCANVTSSAGSVRAARGGNFSSSTTDIAPWSREAFPQTERDFILGVRCARVP